jgi:serine/threonine protein kinase/Flp pilus assembly protein TadD
VIVSRTNLGNFVEAYEEARARDGWADLEAFLPPSGHPLRLAVLRELVRIDLEHGWLAGKPTPLERYRHRFPELFANPSDVREVLFEEYRLRLEAGERTGSTEPAACGQPDRLPEVGESFAGFHLDAELGSGTFGRVFLARQEGLARRFVVLKVGTDLFDESQALAQLLHGNIVPIYSAHRQGALQALCMPCLGVLTLADLLNLVRARGRVPATGAEWLALADQCGRARRAPGPSQLPPPPPRDQDHPLARGGHVESVLWIGACLADGLAHAHERGLLHRDVKPANILWTDDHRPMLLDFNLAVDIHHRVRSRAGGTLPYMSPEQLAEFLGRRGCWMALAPAGAVGPPDGRSDVYALGLLLHELLTGSLPWPTPHGEPAAVADQLLGLRCQGVPDPSGRCPGLTPAVRAILRRCLEPDPRQRYQGAAQLREDLQAQLQHRPLRHVREPSMLERGSKFVRRHPRLLPLVCLLLVLVLAAGSMTLLRQRSQQLARHEAGTALAQLNQEAPEVELSSLLARPGDPPEMARCERLCAELLGGPDDFFAEHWPHLSASQRDELRQRAGHLVLSWARLRLLRAASEKSQELLRGALELNDWAGRLLGQPSRGHLLQRADILDRLGEKAEADRARAAAPISSSNPRDLAFGAAQLRQAGRIDKALAALEQAVESDPHDFRLWFERGLCQETAGDDQAAAASYSTCLALAPGATPARLRRGVCHLRRGDRRAALRDLDKVVQQCPELVEARINRALARAGLGMLPEARADLDSALAQGAPYTRLYFLRAGVRQRLGDEAGRRADLAEGLRREPIDELSWVARAHARMGADPRGALADLERALRLEPNSPTALQNKAHILAEHLGRPAEAVPVLDHLLRLRPNDAVLEASRGVCLARQGRRDEALAAATRCLTRPCSAPALYRVGCILALTARSPEDRRRALLRIEQAIQLGFDHRILARDPDLAKLRGEAAFQALARPDRRLP